MPDPAPPPAPASATPATEVRGVLFDTLDADGTDGVVRTYPYAVIVPRTLPRTPGQTTPGPHRALIFLHGRGECGSDGSRMLTGGLPPAMLSEPDRWPFVVSVPQKPDFDSAWEEHADAVMAMLDRMIARGLVDPDRVALTGLSQGGHGAVTLAAAHPDRFRAVAPVCPFLAPERTATGYGPTDPDDERAAAWARAIASIPLWAFHGQRDEIVPADESRLLVQLIQAAGGRPRLTLFPDAGHNAWDPAYRDTGDALAAWLIQHTE